MPALREAGHDVHCLCRPSSDPTVLGGEVVELYRGDVRHLETLLPAVEEVEVVVHLVAIIREREATFEEVNVQGVRNLLEACRSRQVRVVHMGALGTREDSPSEYSRSKAVGEMAVKESEVPHSILKPSLILGPGGEFTDRFGALVRRHRRVPVLGKGKSLLQPIYVGDVVKATLAALEEEASGRVWELVGPERIDWNVLVARVARVLGLRRAVRHVPVPLARLAAWTASLLPGEPSLTRDELYLMREDVCGDTGAYIELTGEQPLSLDECLRRSFA